MLNKSFNDLRKLTAEVIATNKVLNNHLNKSGTAQLADIVAEVGRQVSAFNEGIKAADPENPTIQQMVEAGNKADERIQRATEGLSKFIEIWPKLNDSLIEPK